MSQPRMAVGQTPVQHPTTHHERRQHQRPGQRHAGDTQCHDGVRGPQHAEHHHSHQVLGHPHPTGPRIGTNQCRVRTPAGLLPQHEPDHHTEQRPAHHDADGPGQRARDVGEQLRQEKVHRPPGVQGDQRGDDHRGEAHQHGADPAPAPKAHRADHDAHDDGGRRSPTNGGVADEPADHERDGGKARVESALAATEQARQ